MIVRNHIDTIKLVNGINEYHFNPIEKQKVLHMNLKYDFLYFLN